MGNGHGGHRVGAGRKPKPKQVNEMWIVPHPSVPAASAAGPSPADVVLTTEEHAPDDLTLDERQVWVRLAPLAVAKGTLTKGTEYAFKLLCRNIVLERRYALSPTDAGTANHRGMIQRVDAELGDFGLRAFGKAVAPQKTKPAANPFAAVSGR